ncbi:MAG: SH3 domain-containing protein [Ardenticatenaceae bacterium]|nr:SH3 domain-containing protein [Ardenticatenaceae bacterium]
MLIILFFIGCNSGSPDVPSPTASATLASTSTSTIEIPSSTPTSIPSSTPAPTFTVTYTPSPTSTFTSTPSSTPTNTNTPTPTNTSTSTPTNTPIPACIVSVSSANIRQGPSTQFISIAIASENDSLPIIAYEPAFEWYLVATSIGQNGWVSASVCSSNTPNIDLPFPVTIPSASLS